jgi:phospholipase/carboxylesterase
MTVAIFTSDTPATMIHEMIHPSGEFSARFMIIAMMALLGFSQGAGMAYQVAPRRRDQLAGVVAIAGRMKRKATLSAEARSMPPFLSLSGADDRLLTADEIAETATALSDAGIPATRNLMADSGHGISEKGIGAACDFLKRVLPILT